MFKFGVETESDWMWEGCMAAWESEPVLDDWTKVVIILLCEGKRDKQEDLDSSSIYKNVYGA